MSACRRLTQMSIREHCWAGYTRRPRVKQSNLCQGLHYILVYSWQSNLWNMYCTLVCYMLFNFQFHWKSLTNPRKNKCWLFRFDKNDGNFKAPVFIVSIQKILSVGRNFDKYQSLWQSNVNNVFEVNTARNII